MAEAPQFSEKQPTVPDYMPFNTGDLLTPWTSFYKPPGDMGDWGRTLDDYRGGVYGELQNLLMGSYGKSIQQQLGLSGQIADADIANWQKAQQAQLGMAPQISAANLQAQMAQQAGMSRQMQALNAELAPQYAATQYGLDQQYMPAYGNLLRGVTEIGAPGMEATYKALGGRINEGLAAGYGLGADLQREIEQSIRGAQDARGVYLGAAPTAEEAYGKGQAMVDLYNTRMGQAQGYINGQTPMDKWGIANSTRMNSATPQYWGSEQNLVNTQGAQVQPSVNQQVAAGIGPTALQGYQNAWDTMLNSQNQYNNALTAAQTPYNSNLLQANQLNNENMFGQYDRTADAWTYNESVRRGLYQTPQTSAGGGMGGSQIGGMVGKGLGAAAGIAGAAIGGTTGAAIGGIGAAASAAAAAICCVIAQKVIPDHWKTFRKWLLTKAPSDFRHWYIFNSRRVANNMTEAKIKLLKPLMMEIIA